MKKCTSSFGDDGRADDDDDVDDEEASDTTCTGCRTGPNIVNAVVDGVNDTQTAASRSFFPFAVPFLPRLPVSQDEDRDGIEEDIVLILWRSSLANRRNFCKNCQI